MKEKFEKNISIKNKRASFDYELLDTFTACPFSGLSWLRPPAPT